MSDQSYTTTIVVDQTPDEAFAAINNVRAWWSQEIDGPTDAPGGVFTYHFEDVHRCTMQIVEFVPGEKVVWLCLENYFSFTEDKSEWTGTKISFEISRAGDKTQVRFTENRIDRYRKFTLPCSPC